VSDYPRDLLVDLMMLEGGYLRPIDYWFCIGCSRMDVEPFIGSQLTDTRLHYNTILHDNVTFNNVRHFHVLAVYRYIR